jgi:DNA-binding NarL/FixJ family response regulator
VVVDISTRGGGGIDLVKQMRVQSPRLVIIVLSIYEESFYAEYVLRAGASGFVTMKEPTEQLVTAIRRAMETGIYVSEKIAEGIVSRFVDIGRPGPKGSMRFFSDREYEVFEYIGQGLSVRQIAEKLQRSVKTVEAHRENLKKKLRLESTAELLRNAIHWVEYRREM